MTVLAVVLGLWLLVLIFALALGVRASRGWQDPYGDLPGVDDGLTAPAVLPSADRPVAGRAGWEPPVVAVSAAVASKVPSDERYFGAIAAAETRLQTLMRSRRPEDRDHFLSTMSVLVRLGDAWMARRSPSTGMPEDVRATLLRCVDARDEQLHSVVASNQAWEIIARAASRARALPDVREVDRAELGHLESHASRRVTDLATITSVSGRLETDVKHPD